MWLQHLVRIVESTGVVVPASGKCIRENLRERSVFPAAEKNNNKPTERCALRVNSQKPGEHLSRSFHPPATRFFQRCKRELLRLISFSNFCYFLNGRSLNGLRLLGQLATRLCYTPTLQKSRIWGKAWHQKHVLFADMKFRIRHLLYPFRHF